MIRPFSRGSRERLLKTPHWVACELQARVGYPGPPYLEAASAQGPMVVCETVYAELAAHFALPGAMDRFLGDIGARLLSSTAGTLEAAARAHREYLARRSSARCPSCNASLPGRVRILADFMIGGHAQKQAEALLTRDRGFYRTYFRSLRLPK